MAFDTKPINKVSDAEWFLKEASETLDWEDLSEDVVMDIGCGTGKSSATFLELFPNVQKVIAIDLYKKNTEEAQANNPHEKLAYEVADIQDRSTLTQWEGQISKVISTYCFNTLRRMEAGFENVWKLLQPEGEAAFLIKLHGPFDNLLETLYLNQEWSPYLASFCEVFPPDSIRNMTEKDYQTMAESAGFEVVGCKETVRVYDYDSEDEYKSFLFQCIPVVKKMSRSLEVKFKDYLLRTILQFNPKTEEGKFCILNNALSLLLRRPPMKAQKEKLN
ncbi:hypothetical protein AVEN_267159-1 [Araneus ventricosus]|uniref:Methyltransferase domain-containing protein n=1 Tax=Araneus ventricosus TaxID=182803 RepID=A0A4Y2LK09_ARAVE|nr:hypothetical protein AVEN_267159-1 [Araneus ventricosus]